jgi:hypothetical protein
VPFVTSPAAASIFESGTLVWTAGAFVPGAVAGITGATVEAAGDRVVFAAGSGVYAFTVQQA